MILLKNISIDEKKILLRVDFNIPIKNNKISDTSRIDKTLPTVFYLLKHNIKKLFIITHLGRPKGKYNKELNLSLIYEYLQSKVDEKIKFICGIINTNNKIICSERIVLFDNIRFNPEEESNIIDNNVIKFREYLTSLCDVYVNDAFGCCHRSHSSIVGINANIKCPGFLVEKEIYYLKEFFNTNSKNKTVTAIIGGSKVKDKIKLLKNIIPKVNYLIIGGGMAFTFLKYFKKKIGKSLFDKEGLNFINNILQTAKENNTKIIYPVDIVCNETFKNEGNIIEIDIEEGIPDDYIGLDIGKKTVLKIKEILNISNTIIWNGPLGVFEFDNFSHGSKNIMEYMSKLNAITIIGGGDTASCCKKFNYINKMTHVSTGGGASLSMIKGEKLVGIDFLNL